MSKLNVSSRRPWLGKMVQGVPKAFGVESFNLWELDEILKQGQFFWELSLSSFEQEEISLWGSKLVYIVM